MEKNKIDSAFDLFFNRPLKEKLEVYTIWVAGAGFIIHLLLILLYNLGGFFTPEEYRSLLGSPIAAIYTPFSFILIYEVYLLIYYLPQSFSVAIAKQFEIVSLIVIRRIFKDISELDTDQIALFSRDNLNLLYDSIGFVLMFMLIFLIRYLIVKRRAHKSSDRIEGFIRFKKILCVILAPLLVVLSVYSFGSWFIELIQLNNGTISEVRDFNNVFYDEFFTAMILVDVLILVASFRYSDRYSLIIRNTGFVITTVLIRISFSVKGLENIILLLSGMLFSLLVLYIYSLYDRIDKGDSTRESYDYL